MYIDLSLKSSLMDMLRKFGLLLFTLTFIMSLMAMTGFGQDEKKKKEDQKAQEKAAKAEEAASKRQAKRERRYQKIKTFALEKYSSDPDFKDAVDDRYRTIRENQTREAYAINMRPSNFKLINRDGEKLRLDHTLYDNPLVQDYVNRVGQSLIPASSAKLFAFKILQNPVPESRALSTGTVYISTGYLAIIDNEAQLAYILGHEIAHIVKEHWFEDMLVDIGTPAYMEKKEPLGIFLKTVASVATLSSGNNSAKIAVANILKAYSIDEAFIWENVQEDEADIESMKYMFARNYDVREIPKLYEQMKKMTSDPRSQTGFIADPTRIKERLEIFTASSQQYTKANASAGSVNLSDSKSKNLGLTGMRGIARMLNETMAPEIQKKLDAGELVASSEEFQSAMALVKRDNGIRSFQFDMFEMARNNLEDSISIRSNDPSAYYYYGKVLKQTARNSSEVSKAMQNLTTAITLDQRQTIAEPYLFRAMLRLASRNPNEAQLITDDLRTYVKIYQRENGGLLPGHMEFVYDFMQDLGVMDYRAFPVVNIATAPIPASETKVVSQPIARQEQPEVVPTPVPRKTPVKKP